MESTTGNDTGCNAGDEKNSKTLGLQEKCDNKRIKGDNSSVPSTLDTIATGDKTEKKEKDGNDPFDITSDGKEKKMDKNMFQEKTSNVNSNERIGSVGSEESSDPSDVTVTRVRRKDWEGNSSDEKSADTLEDASTPGDSSYTSNDSPEKQPEGSLIQNGSSPRPGSLSLPRPLQVHEKKRSNSDGHEIMQKSCSGTVGIPQTRDPEFENIEETLLSKSMPHGTFLRKGEMIEFIADDLQEKIRRSSPMTKTESSGMSSRASSIRSISSISSNNSSAIATNTSGMSRSPSSQFQQSPIDIPPIDPLAVIELEVQAKKVADSVDLMMGNLRSNLHKMSAITVGCLEAYKKSVDTTCDSVDSSIKSMYALMAKCEELSNNMKPVYKLADQIKEIKRLLDRFEGQLTEKTPKS